MVRAGAGQTLRCGATHLRRVPLGPPEGDLAGTSSPPATTENLCCATWCLGIGIAGHSPSSTPRSVEPVRRSVR